MQSSIALSRSDARKYDQHDSDAESGRRLSTQEITRSRPTSGQKSLNEQPIFLSGARSTDILQGGDPLAPSASNGGKFLTTPDTETDLLSFGNHFPNRPIQTATAEKTAVHTPETGGGGYHFTRRFVYSGRVSATAPPSRPHTHDQEAHQPFFHGEPQVTRLGTADSVALPHLTEVVRGLNEKVATDSEGLPSFRLSDLARVIDQAIEKIQPDFYQGKNTSQFVSQSGLELDRDNSQKDISARGSFVPNADPHSSRDEHLDDDGRVHITLEEKLKIKLQIQTSIISDLGRRLDKFMKHNSELVHHNRLLIKERDVAVQTKLDLLRLLNDAQKKEDQGHSTDPKTKMTRVKIFDDDREKSVAFVERSYFEEEALVDAAFQDLEKALDLNVGAEQGESNHAKRVSFSDEVKQGQSKTEETKNFDSTLPDSFDIESSKDWIQYEAHMTSLQRRYEPPSTLGIGLLQQATSYDLSKTNPYADVMRGKPSLVYTTNYHPQKLRQLIQHAEDIITYFSKTITDQTNQLLKASSAEEYIELLHSYLNETKLLLHECLSALVEEQRASRRWKGQCAKFYRDIQKMKELHLKHQMNESALHRKRAAVFLNALEPLSRPCLSPSNSFTSQVGRIMTPPSNIQKLLTPLPSSPRVSPGFGELAPVERQPISSNDPTFSQTHPYLDTNEVEEPHGWKNDLLPALPTGSYVASDSEDLLRKNVQRWIVNPDDPSEITQIYIPAPGSPATSTLTAPAPLKKKASISGHHVHVKPLTPQMARNTLEKNGLL